MSELPDGDQQTLLPHRRQGGDVGGAARYASFGLSVLVWQHLLGIDLYWVILPLAVILLLAVGSDYNLLLVSRFKAHRAVSVLAA